MHIHTLVWVKGTVYVNCSECDLQLRLATYDEAVHLHATGEFSDDGPMLFGEGVTVIVPLDYTIGQVVK